jgi:hypothetical protein
MQGRQARSATASHHLRRSLPPAPGQHTARAGITKRCEHEHSEYQHWAMCFTMRLRYPPVCSFLLHLRQRRLDLGQPEGYCHLPVECEGRRQLSAGLLPLTSCRGQRAQATVAVGLERAHA